MRNAKLVCTNCSRESVTHEIKYQCDFCGGSLEVELINNGYIDTSKDLLRFSTFERYHSFFPYLKVIPELTLGVGSTPLLKMAMKNIDLENLYVKNETVNPTWSFKDRGTALGIMHAKAYGYKKVGTVSSGNMAVSVAAFGQNADMDTLILVNQELSQEKADPIMMYGSRLIRVEGDYSTLYSESLRIGNLTNRYFINSDAPFRIEGYKTLAYEVFEQLQQVPDFIAVPTSAGGHIRGIEKGFRELKESGITDKLPRMIVCQSEGCHPIVKAMDDGSESISKFIKTSTLAHATENAFPPSGNQVLRMLRTRNGLAVKITDAEILEMQRNIANKGIFVQPASTMSLVGVKKLRDKQIIKQHDTVVCIATGCGLKYNAIFNEYNFETESCKIAELENFAFK